MTRSNLSSSVTGSSLQAESPLSVDSYLLSHGFDSCPLVFGILPLLDSLLSLLLLLLSGFPLCFVGSSLGFLSLSSLPVGVSRLRLFVSLTPFCCSPYCGGFPHTLILGYRFLLFYSCAVAVALSNSFNLFSFHYYWRRHSGKFSRLLPQVFSFASSVPLRLLHLASSSIPYGPKCPWDSVACPLPYRLLYIEPVLIVLVHSLPYRMLILW